MKTFNIPNSVRQISTKLRANGFGPMPLRTQQLVSSYLVRGSAGNLLSDNLVFWADASLGLTASANAVSRWKNLALAGPTFNTDLVQGTAASQPVSLLWDGMNYLYAPAVAANYASTPSAAANRITGDIDIRAYVAATDWTPTGYQNFVAKVSSSLTISYSFGLQTGSTGNLFLYWSTGGSSATEQLVISTVATGFTDLTGRWVRATLDVNNGAGGYTVVFYTSTDGQTWTQLGANVVGGAPTSIFDSASPLAIGTSEGSPTQVFGGKIFRAQIYNGINGTLVADFNPAQTTNNSTSWVSSTGETWTVNQSGATPAQVVGASSLLFDGTNDNLKTAPFALSQPSTVYLVGSQISWTTGDGFFDGNTADSMRLRQSVSSPQIRLSSGNDGTLNADLALGVRAVITSVFNGTSPSLRINHGTAVTGNVGTANAGGFTLGAVGDVSAFANIQVSEVLVFSQAHSQAVQDVVIAYLRAKWGI